MSMAQSTPASTLCKYFIYGACSKGDSCAFSHDRSTPPDLVCRFYLRGQCAYGDKCRFDHTNRKNRSRDFGNVNSSRDAVTRSAGKTPEKKDKGMTGSAAMRSPPVSSFRDSEYNMKSNFIPLGKEQVKISAPKWITKSPEEWVKAKEFTPGQFYVGSVPPSYASAVGGSKSQEDENFNSTFEVEGASWDGSAVAVEAFNQSASEDFREANSNLLCPYLMAKGECPYNEQCAYTHGDVCDMCGVAILHPSDKDQREQHIKECMEAHETDMEHSFKVAASQGKTCGICMDVVLEKEPPSSRRFGILENCNHCFCLTCIRQWRCAKQFEKVIVKACPECRVNSNFVTPSALWVDNPEEKTNLIETYKKALKEKPCRHFDQGRGDCPFSDSCFYRHALPDGTLAPPQPRKPRKRHNADGELERMVGLHLWDFLESRELHREIAQMEDSLELMNYLAMELLDTTFSDGLSDDDLSSDDI